MPQCGSPTPVLAFTRQFNTSIRSSWMVSAISASWASHWWRWEANHLSCNLRDLIQMISLRTELNCAMYSDGNSLNMISLHFWLQVNQSFCAKCVRDRATTVETQMSSYHAPFEIIEHSQPMIWKIALPKTSYHGEHHRRADPRLHQLHPYVSSHTILPTGEPPYTMAAPRLQRFNITRNQLLQL